MATTTDVPQREPAREPDRTITFPGDDDTPTTVVRIYRDRRGVACLAVDREHRWLLGVTDNEGVVEAASVPLWLAEIGHRLGLQGVRAV